MKVVVSGASGFIGRCLMHDLPEAVGLTRGDSSERLIHTDYSYESLVDTLKGVDVVVHLASIRGFGKSYKHFHENAELTENLLKASIDSGVKRIIYLSSIAVYSDEALLPWKEDQPVSPQTFYALSKIVGEHLCELYSRDGLSYVIFRCGIVFGISSEKRMTDVFIRNASRGETLTVFGNSVAKRSYIYVKDVSNAILWAINSNIENQVFNLSYDKSITNYEFAELVNKAFNNDKLVYNNDLVETIHNSYMNTDKIIKNGYQPKYDLQTALKDISFEWSIEINDI